jgi:hypothetical protein
LTAPFVSEINPVNNHQVQLKWRNNDVSTQWYIILRRTTNSSFTAIDSVPVNLTQYDDSTLLDFVTQ